MKKILVGALVALYTVLASATTYTPVQLLNPAGSSAGQAIVSTGSSTSPAWGGIGVNGIAAIAANTVIANATGSIASPTAFAMPSCSGTNNALRWTAGTGFTCASSIALTSSGLNQFASTTSAQLAGVISDETGSGALVFATNPAFAGFTTTAATTFGASANISYSTPALNINDTSAAATARTSYQSNGTNVWAWVSNSPSGNLQVNRYVSGTLTDQPISISNSTGIVTMPDGLTVNGTVSGTGFSNYLASPPAIGGTAAAAGTFTNLTATGTVTGITGRLLGVQVFSVSGTYTPTTGTGRAIVDCVGAGGGGGGTAATSTGQSAIGQAGSSGSYARIYWTSPSSQTVTIGAAGTAASGAAGGNGGTTSVGSIVSCPGGVGGTAGSAASNSSAFTVGAAAQASAPTVSGVTTVISSVGNQGTYAMVLNASYALNGQGGASPLTGGGGNVAGGKGSGGAGGIAGASSAATAGTAGAAGEVIVYEYQ